MLATQESFALYLGVKLGLYEALHAQGSADPDTLARRTGLAPRYVREWLEQQASAGLIGVDDPSAGPRARAYHLPPGHERVLTRSADPLSMVWTAVLPVGGIAASLPALLEAFRTGDGVPAEAFGDDWRHGHGGANRSVYTERLAAWLRRYLPDAHRRLAGGPGHVADLGCGSGWGAFALAAAYPAARVTAVDVDGPAVDDLRARVADAGLAGRIEAVCGDAARLDRPGAFDLVCLFDVLHEARDAVGLLDAARRLAAPGAPVLVLDSLVAEHFRAPGDDLERFQYATSVLHCLPAALDGADAGARADGTAGIGTVMRPAVVRARAAAAGFRRVRSYDLDDRFHRLYRLDA